MVGEPAAADAAAENLVKDLSEILPSFMSASHIDQTWPKQYESGRLTQ